MNVCFIYDCEYPWDIRVTKLTKYLTEKKHNVYLVCRNNNRDKQHSVYNDVEIFRLPSIRFSKKLTKIINLTLFFNPFWLFKIYNIVYKKRCNLIIIRDLPMSATASIVGKLFRIPVIIDMAEPYPLTVMQRRTYERFKLSHIVTRNIILASLYEKIMLKSKCNFFVVCQEAEKRLVARGGKCTRITVIRNTPNLKEFSVDSCLARPLSVDGTGNEFIVLYVGILIAGRGLSLAIRAFSMIAKKRPNIKLVIIGTGKREAYLRRMVYDLSLEQNVIFEGWVENSLIPSCINQCDLGLLPFLGSQHINHTVANKLYDFMALGKPVLCSDVTPMKRILLETSAGFLFEVGDAVSMKNKILEIEKNKQALLLSRGRQGLIWTEKKYNWSSEMKKMDSILHRFGSAG